MVKLIESYKLPASGCFSPLLDKLTSVEEAANSNNNSNNNKTLLINEYIYKSIAHS